MDLSSLSDSDLQAIAKGDMRMVSERGLMFIAGDPAPSQPLNIGKAGFGDAMRETLQGVDWGTRNIASAGTALSDLWQGAKQFVGQGDQQQIEANKIMQDEAPIGALAGNIAATAVPFGLAGKSLKAAGAVGAGFGAMQPVQGEQTLGNVAQGKAMNTALGGGLAAGGQAVANKVGGMVSNKLTDLATKKAQQGELNATLQEARNAGYVVPPSYAPTSGTASRVLEGLSGKYKTNQLAGIRNQNTTDTLARRAVGLADDAPLTSESMQQIRAQAFQQGYAPVTQIGTIKTDATFIKALDDLNATQQGAARSFPGAVPDSVNNLINGVPGMHGGPRTGGLKVAEFDAGDAIKMTQILRDEAGSAYAKGDKALGAATKKAAKAIEDQIERSLVAQGKNGADLLKGFREARTLMAKAHTVEDAIKEGGGRVNAMKLGSRVQAQKPMTGELATIGKFANNFGDVAKIPVSGNANPLTALDFMQGGISAPLGAMAGGPAGLAAVMGLPAARIASRYGLLSDAAQNALVRPDYALGLPTRATAGLLGKSAIGGTVLGLPAFGQ